MNRFWSRYIKPIIDTAQPRRLLEIGADSGWNTRNILAYCLSTGAHADIVDPAPRAVLHEVLAEYPAQHTYHALKSVDAIPRLAAVPDIALLDGDHNWATVYRELELIHDLAVSHDTMPPILLFHDVAWPYARRDMYYKPSDIPDDQRHPYAYVGMLPGVSELVENGMNGVLANAVHEGGPRNGVLTAIEDFITGTSADVSFYKLPFFNGLGIMVPRARMTAELQTLIDGFYTAESLLDACVHIDLDSMHLRAILAQTEAALTRRTEALKRAHELLARKNATIEKMAEQLQQAGTDNEVRGALLSG